MKIRLYSWFLSGNIGDILIAEEVSKLFFDCFDCDCFDISSFKQVDGPLLLKNSATKHSFKKRLLSISLIRELIDFSLSFKINHFVDITGVYDAAIFAGGNSLMELNRYGAYYSKRLYNHILFLKQHDIKICFLYAGVGPIRSCIGKKYIKKILNLSDYITVRDNQSLGICRSLTSKKISIWRDPVLLKETYVSLVKRECISINVFFGENEISKSKMKKSYISLIQNIRQTYPDYEIVLFVTEVSDLEYLDTLKKALNDCSNISFNDFISAPQLCDLYSRTKYVVGVRMHSIILSIVYNKPFVAIGWQPKVESLLDFFNSKDRYVSQNDFCKYQERVFRIVESSFMIQPNLSCALKELSIENEANIKSLFDMLRNGDKNGLSM